MRKIERILHAYPAMNNDDCRDVVVHLLGPSDKDTGPISKESVISVECDGLSFFIPTSDASTEIRRHFESFAKYVATCQRSNTDEWMRMLVDNLNGVALRFGDTCHFEYRDGVIDLLRK